MYTISNSVLLLVLVDNKWIARYVIRYNAFNFIPSPVDQESVLDCTVMGLNELWRNSLCCHARKMGYRIKSRTNVETRALTTSFFFSYILIELI